MIIVSPIQCIIPVNLPQYEIMSTLGRQGEGKGIWNRDRERQSDRHAHRQTQEERQIRTGRKGAMG